MKLVKLTFVNDHRDFGIGGLTQKEVERVVRIFFRFLPELFLAEQGNAKKVSPTT